MVAELATLRTPTGDELRTDDGARIARLTNDAVLASADRAAKDVMQAIVQAEGILKILREEAEQLASEMRRHAEAYAARVGKAIDGMREISLSMREKRDTLTANFSQDQK